MPTPFEELQNSKCKAPNKDWATRGSKPPRSVFGNYGPDAAADKPNSLPEVTALWPRSASPQKAPGGESGAPVDSLLQSAIDIAMARSFLYRFLAQAFEQPTEQGWAQMSGADSRQVLEAAARLFSGSAPALVEALGAFRSQLNPGTYDLFLESYLAAFGHAARGSCPLNEIEYGDIKADALFQPHRLADLAAFYRAFGLELAEDAGERQDHLCLELEFMCVLSAKEAYALEHQLDAESLALGRDAQKRFLREHLGRWAPAFGRRLARLVGENPLGALAKLICTFVEAECARYGVAPGSEDLLLRPVDEAAESMCSSCGLTQLPPGAAVI